VAVDGHGPVGDAVRVDLAAEDASRRGVHIVRRDAVGLSGNEGCHEGRAENKELEHLGGEVIEGVKWKKLGLGFKMLEKVDDR
jgi:hypothetical protein